MNKYGVIFDLAGTIIDYGSLAPIYVFIALFKKYGIILSEEQAKFPMGLQKLQHIKELFKDPDILKQYIKLYNTNPTDNVIYKMYLDSIEIGKSIIPIMSQPIFGVEKIIQFLIEHDIKIGSTTGYSKEIIQSIIDYNSKNFDPNLINILSNSITSDNVIFGRPEPWMIYHSAEKMRIYPMSNIVKIDDTLPGLLEGINAGTLTIGVVKTGSFLGLTKENVDQLDTIDLDKKLNIIRQKMYSIGCDYVVDSVNDIIPILIKIFNLK